MREIAGGLLTLAYTTGEYGFCRHAVQPAQPQSLPIIPVVLYFC